MKPLPLLVLAASSAVWSSPPLLGVGHAAPADGLMCALGPTSEGYVPLLDMPASAVTIKDVKRLVAALCPKGCGQVGVFRNPTSPNAMTTTVGSHMSKIAYSTSFVDTAIRTYGAGAALGILAHEVGHHVDANAPAVDWMSSQWGNELRADAWAGCALAKAGGKAGELRAAVQALATYPSASHPAWTERAVALQKGYRTCGGTTLAALEPSQNRRLASRESSRPGSAGLVRGCAEDLECKVGRVCLDGRCQDAALRRACSKDIDCPGTQICAGAGLCQAAGPPGGRPPVAAGIDRIATSSATPSACHDQCGTNGETCSSRSDRVLRECKAALVSDPRYTACTCPRWPAEQLDCYQFCKETFDKAKACEAAHEAAGTACLSVADRCASDCS